MIWNSPLPKELNTRGLQHLTLALQEAPGSSSAPAGEETSKPPLRARLSFCCWNWARTSGILASLRGIAFALTLGMTLLRSRLVGLFGSESRQEALRQRDQEALIRRGVGLLGELKGAFVKAGQFASHRHDLIPLPVATALATLRDQAPPIEFSQIRQLIRQELGRQPEDIFASLDPKPIGAASIAQVHLGTLPDNTPVAVKVQYPWIRDSLAADLRVIRWGFRIFDRCRSSSQLSFDFEGVFSEFELGLRDELDFEAEAQAAAEIAFNLQGDSQVCVPEIFTSFSSPRVLTMRYRPCVNIADRAGLARLGADPAALVQIIARAYAKQIFVDGLFHADPHSGNLFVLDEGDPKEEPRILFVDFGLHRRLSPDLRTALRLGMYALLQRDSGAFICRMQDMGMIEPGAEAGVLAAVQTMFNRLAEESSGEASLSLASDQVVGLKDEAKRLLRETPGLQLPNDLLLYAKTLSYLFAVGEDLAPEVDLMKISTPFLLQFLASRD